MHANHYYTLKKAQDDNNDDADCYIKNLCRLVHIQCSVCAHILKNIC